MSLTMYQASIPTFIHMLGNLAVILTKAEAYAKEKAIEPPVLIHARLAPTMYALNRQVQIASDAVKGCAARLAGIDVPSFPDTENSFPELQERIAKTVAFLKTITPAQLEGSEERVIRLTIGGKEQSFPGRDYLFSFVLPHFYFHVTAAYAILRHNGLDVGKKDYLGNS